MLQERPLCKCHGEPMRKACCNGGWRCNVKAREADERYSLNNPRRYTTRRRYQLRKLRERIEEQLTNLRKENP